MARININKDRCKGCLLCISVCPKKLISQENKLNRRGVKSVTFDQQGECLGCMLCAIICPDCCIEVYKYE